MTSTDAIIGVLLVLALIYLLWQLVDVKLWKQARVEFKALQDPPYDDRPEHAAGVLRGVEVPNPHYSAPSRRTALLERAKLETLAHFGDSRTPIKIQAWRQK